MSLSSTLLAAAVGGMLTGVTACGGAAPQANDPAASSGDMASAPMGAGAKHACKGQNECKGQGGCKTDKNGCKGQNECKGQGGCKTT